MHLLSSCARLQPNPVIQFQYNPEWFEDEDEGEDDWDLAKYRKEQEDERLAAEDERIRQLSLQDDGYRETSTQGDSKNVA